MNYKIISLVFLMLTVLGCQKIFAQFTIADQDGATSIVYDIEHSALDSIAAHLLARDIEAVTGQQPKLRILTLSWSIIPLWELRP